MIVGPSKGVQVARKIVDEPSEDVVANAKRERAARRNPFARIALFIRQVIAEFGPGCTVICANLRGERRVTTLADLLPDAFGPW